MEKSPKITLRMILTYSGNPNSSDSSDTSDKSDVSDVSDKSE